MGWALAGSGEEPQAGVALVWYRLLRPLLMETVFSWVMLSLQRTLPDVN